MSATAAAEAAIRELVDRETRAWDRQDAAALIALMHPDMVWPWPPDPTAHDPRDWVLELGRFDAARWRRGWQELFDGHRLVHNRRRLVKIVVSREGDGGFAVVDVDTLWQRPDGGDFHWLGLACKVYTRTDAGWKMIFQTGLLDYAGAASPARRAPGATGGPGETGGA